MGKFSPKEEAAGTKAGYEYVVTDNTLIPNGKGAFMRKCTAPFDDVPLVPYTGCTLAKRHAGDAAYDVESMEDEFIPPGEFRTIMLDLRVMIPEGWVGLLFGRSGMGARGVGMVNGVGVIDSGYRGFLRASLYNCSREGYKVREGDRVAQLMLIEPPEYAFAWVGQREFLRLKNANRVDSRGEGGLGSTGV